ncbi:MAG TPA: SPOR domain-containing protein, partial [Mucilaginibacter sp.]
LIARRPVLGKQVSATGDEPANGYRVQIFFGSSRQAAYDAQAKINEEHPELRTYITYNEPNFKVRAGDFRTRLEAEKLMKEITPLFTSLFIIPEKINPPKQDNSND